MFDLGFSELVVIAVVLLVVVGPERLPGVARTAGHLFGRVQRYITDVKADIRREMQIDDLKKLQAQTRAFEQSLQKEMGAIHADVQEALSPPESGTANETAALRQEAGAEEGAVPANGETTAQVGAQALLPGMEPEIPAPAASADGKPMDCV
ncbi:MAG: Sec-independent protein translocase protein TatB [Azoarcus sp.]|jgi:sec-independent protein translocase protein TatB|nr:Sec-independent protein translocase protein TatB [Azoarcus sp.]